MFPRCTNPAPLEWRESNVDRLFELQVEQSMSRHLRVTVCIGVLSDARHPDGHCIILSADGKGTYGSPPRTTNTVAGKIHDFYPTCPNLAAAIAGDSAMCHATVGALEAQLSEMMRTEAPNWGGHLVVDHVRMAIAEARRLEYEKFVAEEMRALIGMNLAEWQVETNAEKRRKGLVITRCARRFFPVHLIVGGFMGPIWVLVNSAGGQRILGGDSHYASGAGSLEALRVLHKRQHDAYSPWPTALVHVAEAMEAARRAYPDYIGRPGDYLLMRENDPIMRFPRRSKLLQGWVKRGTQYMVVNESLRKQFEAELYQHVSANKYSSV
jgi:hypothetical protein